MGTVRAQAGDPAAVTGHETKTQGELLAGTEQVPAPRGAHRARAQGGSAKLAKRKPIDFRHSPTESQLHQSVSELLDRILVEPAFFCTFPAGWGKLTKGTAGRLFASGLKRGMPDIFVFDRIDKNQNIVGIELKTGNNSATSAQRAMHAKLQAVGIPVYICRSQEDVLAALYRENISCRSLHMGALNDQRNPAPAI